MYKIDYDYNVNLLYDILASQLAKIIPINEKTIQSQSKFLKEDNS